MRQQARYQWVAQAGEPAPGQTAPGSAGSGRASQRARGQTAPGRPRARAYARRASPPGAGASAVSQHPGGVRGWTAPPRRRYPVAVSYRPGR